MIFVMRIKSATVAGLLLWLSLAAGLELPSMCKPQVAMANQAIKQPANFHVHGPMSEHMQDGSQTIESMYDKADQLKDYSCQFEITVFKKDTAVEERGNLHYKKPRMLRSEETGPYHNGAVVTLRKDGKARAHYGGALKFFTVTLSPEDQRLNASNGYPMKDSDFLSLAAFLKNWLAEGIKSRVTGQPVAVEAVDKPVLILEMYRQNEAQSVLKRIFLDPETHLPVRWDDFDYDFPSLSRWHNIKANIGLSEELFDL